MFLASSQARGLELIAKHLPPGKSIGCLRADSRQQKKRMQIFYISPEHSRVAGEGAGVDNHILTTSNDTPPNEEVSALSSATGTYLYSTRSTSHPRPTPSVVATKEHENEFEPFSTGSANLNLVHMYRSDQSSRSRIRGLLFPISQSDCDIC
jgi:hypothetical protein